MDVLARYCSIPGYNKLCCDSCSKRTGTLTPLLIEATEMDEHVRFGSASKPLEILTASAYSNSSQAAPLRSRQGPKEPPKPGSAAKHIPTVPPKKGPLQPHVSQKWVPPHGKPVGRNAPAMASSHSLLADQQADAAEVERMERGRETRWPAFSEVVR